MTAALELTPTISFLTNGEDFQRVTVKWTVPPGRPAYLWHKLNGQPWQALHPQNPSEPLHNPKPDQGTVQYQRDVGGGAYQVAAFLQSHFDPNAGPFPGDPDPLGFGTCIVLRDRVTTLLAGEEQGSGGTWTAWFVTSTEPTLAFMRVSTTEPLHPDAPVGVPPYPPEWLDFPSLAPTGALTEVFDQNQNVTPDIGHDLEIAPPGLPTGPAGLWPGRNYWRIELLVALDGRWQINKRQVLLKNRTVRIILKEIFIIDDGADGDGEASFKIWIVDGVKFANACSLDTRPISDEPSPGEEYLEHIALSADCQVPIDLPARFIEADIEYRVAILTRAIGKHPIGTDDISGNIDPQPGNDPPIGIPGNAMLRFRTGSDQNHGEIADSQLQAFAIPAGPLTEDNEFSYEIRGTYSVNYS